MPSERRDFAGRLERAVPVAIEPVEIEAQKNEGRAGPLAELRNSARAATTPGLARQARARVRFMTRGGAGGNKRRRWTGSCALRRGLADCIREIAKLPRSVHLSLSVRMLEWRANERAFGFAARRQIMKYLGKIGRRWNLWPIVLIVLFGWSMHAFAQETETGFPSWVHLETDGIFVYYKPQDLGLYRRLLPTMFDMPDIPMVHIYIDDFYKMTAGSQPYREAAVFLLGRYKGQDVWWCVSMPVTTVAARDLGRLGGWPKVIGDISLQRNDPDFAGTVNLDGRPVLDIRLETGQHSVTESENQWFQRLRGIEKLTMVDGRLKTHEARANRRAGKFSLIDLASMNYDKFTMKVGAAQISLSPPAAGESDADAAFGLKPQEIVLAFYFKNKFHWSLLHPDVAR